jgi:AcrR family transcriptional regulator
MRRIVKKPEVRRQEIVAAATELFLAKEYEKTSMNDVMKALSIAKGTIYHYFESKEKLLEAAVDHLVEAHLRERLEKLEASRGNALMKLRILFPSDGSAGQNDQTIDQLHKPGNIRLHTRMLGVLVKQMAPVFGKLVRQGCEEGLFESEYPEETAELLLAGVQFLVDEGFFPWEEGVILRRQRAIPRIVESALKAERGSFDFLFPQAPTQPDREGDDAQDAADTD